MKELNHVYQNDRTCCCEIYDYHTGSRGALLGTEELSAGLNTNVKVGLGIPADRDVLAVLKVNGQEVLTKDYDIR